MSLPACFSDKEAKKVIQKLCKENEIDVLLLQDLCEVFIQFSGAGRKDGVVAEFNTIIDRFSKRSSESLTEDE